MRKVFTFALTLLPMLTLAEQKVDVAKLKHPVKACLFKIEGKGLHTASYLFGTIHLSDPRVIHLHPNAESAFVTADIFYSEIDLDIAAQFKVAPLIMRNDGKKLTQAIGPRLTNKLDAVLKEINPALSSTPFESLKTWAVAVTLPLLENQLMAKKPLDAVLYQRAIDKKKKTAALESADSQVAVFDQFNEQEQQSILSDSIEQMIAEQKLEVKSVERLLNVYLTGSTLEIAQLMTNEMEKMNSNPELAERLLKALLDDRNVGMANKADQFLQAEPEKSHFFAVGAAHYTGKLAVQDLLKKKGYTITPLFD
ncbi:MAG: TraB/GumN family protein [Akkermansiaceae bacterium]